MAISMQRDGSKLGIMIFPKQRQFIESQITDILYGGSAGGGKSIALLLFAAKRRMEYAKSHGVIFRRTFPDLKRSLVMMAYDIYPQFGAKYNATEFTWTFPNGSVQRFAHLEADKTCYDHRSAEYQDICFDEASLFTEYMILYMTSRLRSTIPGMKPLLRLASNPGGPGHGFLKRRYIIPSESSKIWKDPVTGMSTTFISSKATDNPMLMKNDPGYIQFLKGLPEKERLALLEGRWDVFSGQFFSEWNPDRHVLKEVRNPDTYTKKFLSIDWGYAEPCAVLWYEITPLGRIFIYRELYCTRRSPKELGKDILDLSPPNEKFTKALLSPETFGKKIELEGGGEPIADLIQQGLGNRIKLERANNARDAGWSKVREYFGLAPDGFPWVQFSPNCKNCIRTIPDMIHDERVDHVEDMSDKGEDHCSESLRYGLISLNTVPKVMLSPYRSTYEKIFGTEEEKVSNVSNIPGKYGR